MPAQNQRVSLSDILSSIQYENTRDLRYSQNRSEPKDHVRYIRDLVRVHAYLPIKQAKNNFKSITLLVHPFSVV